MNALLRFDVVVVVFVHVVAVVVFLYKRVYKYVLYIVIRSVSVSQIGKYYLLFIV